MQLMLEFKRVTSVNVAERLATYWIPERVNRVLTALKEKDATMDVVSAAQSSTIDGE